MGSMIRAALAYFAIVFAAGFVLGALRTLWLAPAIGPMAAVAAELPLMLGVSWIACGWCLTRFGPLAAPRRAAMGGVAFALLMASELGLALALGGTTNGWAAALLTPQGLLGLAGQIAFAAMPLVRRGE
ncbi:hypothetical protein ACFQ1E_11260 [Sphingomonas canadensis]|uniref:DUF4345 domain-containing protein n=1 Tax=Sphingomonas canadensis TaxID=1219257 RepID=A0ABW3H647_9SPHN|nr:hypothetical protein [Sphingomonas canadensis]MCW3836301.1 hypothetical protein [Sphingomonas canadensis]